MSTVGLAIPLFLLMAQGIGDVQSKEARHIDFGAYRTYAWVQERAAYDRPTHDVIVEAVEAEMARLGFTKTELARADVTIRCDSLRASWLDKDALKKVRKQGSVEPSEERIMGLLTVVMRDPGRPDPVWEATTRRLLSEDAATRNAEIRSAVSELFEKYPGEDQRKP